MSANYEFPKGWLKSYTTLEGGTYVERFIPTFDPEATEDWFKRMIEDAPQPRHDKLFSERYMHLGLDHYKWFEKWFSQFRNNKE